MYYEKNYFSLLFSEFEVLIIIIFVISFCPSVPFVITHFEQKTDKIRIAVKFPNTPYILLFTVSS